jgi:hypothetical protein
MKNNPSKKPAGSKQTHSRLKYKPSKKPAASKQSVSYLAHSSTLKIEQIDVCVLPKRRSTFNGLYDVYISKFFVTTVMSISHPTTFGVFIYFFFSNFDFFQTSKLGK